MTNVQKEVNVEGLGKIFYCNDSAYDKASYAVLEESDELITFRDLAYARIQEGKNSSVSQNGSYVKEGSLFVPNANNKRIWLRESLVYINPALAVNAHSKGKEYLLSEDFNVDVHLEHVGRDNYFILKDTSNVPTNRFGEDERTVWAFQDQAENYGKFLEGAGKSSISIYMHTGNDKHIDKQSRPFANQLWLRGLVDDSSVKGGRSLDYDSWVRGVQRIGEADTRKNVDLYSLDQIRNTFKNMNLEGLTDSYLKELIKVKQ
ncbi:MAG: hypothetical protein ACP5NV_02235 [Candidatus Woesearchaeota archaeon]